MSWLDDARKDGLLKAPPAFDINSFEQGLTRPGLESQNGETNTQSGAFSKYQYLPQTGKMLGVTPESSQQELHDAFVKFTNLNLPMVQNAVGRVPTNEEMYLAHGQGGAGAAALLKAPDAPAVDTLSQLYQTKDDPTGVRGATQALVENGIPAGATGSDVAQFYARRWNQGGKGADGEESGSWLDQARKDGLLGGPEAGQGAQGASQEGQGGDLGTPPPAVPQPQTPLAPQSSGLPREASIAAQGVLGALANIVDLPQKVSGGITNALEKYFFPGIPDSMLTPTSVVADRLKSVGLLDSPDTANRSPGENILATVAGGATGGFFGPGALLPRLTAGVGGAVTSDYGGPYASQFLQGLGLNKPVSDVVGNSAAAVPGAMLGAGVVAGGQRVIDAARTGAPLSSLPGAAITSGPSYINPNVLAAARSAKGSDGLTPVDVPVYRLTGDEVPGQAGVDAAQKAAEQFNQRLSRELYLKDQNGELYKNFTPQILADAKDKLGQRLQNNLAPVTINNQNTLKMLDNELTNIEMDAQNLSVAPDVKKMVDDVKKVVNQPSGFDGTDYFKLTNFGSELQQKINAGDVNTQIYAKKIRDALDRAVDTDTHPGVLQAVQRSRYQYRIAANLQDHVIDQAPGGLLSPDKVYDVLARNFGSPVDINRASPLKDFGSILEGAKLIPPTNSIGKTTAEAQDPPWLSSHLGTVLSTTGSLAGGVADVLSPFVDSQMERIGLARSGLVPAGAMLAGGAGGALLSKLGGGLRSSTQQYVSSPQYLQSILNGGPTKANAKNLAALMALLSGTIPRSSGP